MYITKYSILFICVIVSLVLLYCTNADSSEQQQQEHFLETSDEDYDDLIDVYRRASLRPVVVHQRASLRPFTGKRASLRPVGKRASLRPFGKRASLRPPTYFGK
ncbi:unnamed protein product [Adineta steineri]|uniref:Uncharacterized protein n=1 Tax=Adineta steineri TaxID=433720 RepID=A0A814M0P3_9BILA|nr:unnamed protein product [Adineta steineri]CAF1536556.1 unnamed protein product [Adineta steineri]